MGPKVTPTPHNRNAPDMLAWLCDVFGLERHLVAEDGAGHMAHAQLVHGDGMIMLGPAGADPFGKLQSTPDALGGSTQSPYVAATDADHVYARAKAAGAQIMVEVQVQDEGYGGRGFSYRDPAGHLWNIGTNDRWQPST
jgi:uncharacterized glyoxalase superfamily protein PhnB